MSKEVLIFVGESERVPSTQVALQKKSPAKKGDLGAPRLLKASSNFTSIPVDTLKGNLQQFIGTVRDILSSSDKPVPTSQDGLKLKTFDVAVAISGEGQVGFFGTGVKAGASATLTLHFEIA
jgi:hypothetical protein